MKDLKATELLAEAQAEFDEALDLYASVENQQGEGYAETIEKADRIQAAATEKMNRATKMKELEERIAATKGAIERDRQAGRAPGGGEPGASSGPEFKTLNEFLFAIWQQLAKNRVDARLEGTWFDGGREEGKALAEADGTTGGYLVPPEILTNLMSVGGETSVVRSRATVIPMRRRELNMPILDQTGTTANQPHWFGGMQFYWEDEAGQMTESSPTFRQMRLVAHKLIGYTRVSDELNADSAVSLGSFLSSEMGFVGGARWWEDYTFLRGTGAGQPLGILNAGATISVARKATANFTYDDFANMLERFLPSAQGVWVFNQSAMAELITLSGPTGNPAFIWHPNSSETMPGRLLGLPVVFTEKTPTFNNAGDVLLADFRFYLVGDRQATTVESTQFDRWQFGQTSWRMVHRVDGQPWLSAPITLQDGSSTISPFVQLGAKTT